MSLHTTVQRKGRIVETRIDHIAGGIYRIATMTEAYGITFNQFLIDDERPMLVHTGEHGSFDNVRRAIREVLDPKRLAYIALLHWEGDECGGLERFIEEAPEAEVVGRPEPVDLEWVHAMHGGSLTREALPSYVKALREQDFGWQGRLMGRELGVATG